MTPFPPTSDDTLGPYFPACFASAAGTIDLFRPQNGLTVGAVGKPLVLRIRLLDIDGSLADSTLLELWQANSEGHLRVPGNEAALADDPFFEGYGRVYSRSGEFQIRTVMPGAMRTGPTTRAPFITLTIFSDGISRIVTQVFFEGAAENEADPVLGALPDALRERLIARRQGEAPEGAVYALDIKMRGDGETPFFDDLVSELGS